MTGQRDLPGRRRGRQAKDPHKGESDKRASAKEWKYLTTLNDKRMKLENSS